jgi:HEAT repeat protein/ADP-heptose:LPS heptosyltransferase
VARLFEFLATSSSAPNAWTRVRGILCDVQLAAQARRRLLPALARFIEWHEDLVGLDGVVAVAESLESPDDRAFLLDHGVERFVFCAPEAFTIARLERVAALFEHAPRYRYVLRFLSERRGLPGKVRSFLDRQLAGRFPLRERIAEILLHRPAKVLVLVNTILGQGDEIVRMAPLLQGLLDANPDLTITLIAQRVYLYDCPRVTAVPIRDDGGVDAALGTSFDAVIELFQPDLPEVASRFELHEALERSLDECRPPLLIRAELGRIKKGDLGIHSEFLFETIELDGRDIAHARGLDRVARQSTYEPCLRLLAELGLPQRVAEETPLTASLLTGVESAEAERAWRGLVATASSPRPVALFNPLGGAGATKGLSGQDAILAAEVGGLVDEGYLVVVLPSGRPWGRPAILREGLSRLDPATRAHVRVAPDPGEADPTSHLELRERPGLDYADRVMRLFKYFASYADLVVTVEGWLAHLAYNLGRPFRLFLAAGAFPSAWFPYGRGPRQRLVSAFSPRCRAYDGKSALLRSGDPPPIAHQPRRDLLQLALAGVGFAPNVDWVAPLRLTLASPDHVVQRWAAVALGRIPTVEASDVLLSALQDEEPTVVQVAAETLLREEFDCSRILGPRYRELLQVHVDVVRQNWDAVVRTGPAALPVLFRFAASGNYNLSRQAKSVLRRMLKPYVPRGEIAGGVPSDARSRRYVAEALQAGLTSPTLLDPVKVEHLGRALRLEPDDPEPCELALGAAAAVFYSRPDLADDLVDALADLLSRAELPDGIASRLVKLFEYLAASGSTAAWSRLNAILRDEHLGAAHADRLLPLVGEFVRWQADVVGLDGILALAECSALADHRPYLFDHGVERFVFHAPEAFTVERLDRIARTFSDTPRYRYVLSSLAARRAIAPALREILARDLDERFAFREAAAAILQRHAAKMLVVLNIGMGQGDDLVRLVPLLQGLLDANPTLSITLVTFRPYLYDNPRVTTVPIGDDAALQDALGVSFDGVVEFFQPEWPGFTFRFEAHVAVERYLAEHQPGLVIKGDLGRPHAGQEGSRFSFLFHTVAVGGQDIARSCGLDQTTVRNVYEPTTRLLAELGLPQRAADDLPLTPSIVTGTRSADAEQLWADLVAGKSGAAERRVALLNPFGGSGTTKGFLEQDALVAAEICGLVEEGYRVVVLPNGQPWGRRSAIDKVLCQLASDARAAVTVAPDPAETEEAAKSTLSERPELAYRDRVMRAFKYFASYADLVVTVEGWLAHLAYILGRPFRLFLAAGSYPSEYHPRDRGPGQQLVTVLSPRTRARYCDTALLREGDPPPLPHQPRKILLELAMPALGRCGSAATVEALSRSLASPDAGVRTWAVIALGRVRPAVGKAHLITSLRDRSPAVVREAADALLREEVDCGRELGPRYREVLQAHAEIVRLKWDAVAAIGPPAIPALFHAAGSEVFDVSHGAKVLLARMLTPFVPRLQASNTNSTT